MMRASLFFAPLLALIACGGKDAVSAPGGGGHDAGGGTDAGNSGGGGATNSGGTLDSGGVTSAGGQAPAGGGVSDPGLVICDLRKVACKIAQPICPENQVPSVEGACYGPCVPIESCACAAAEECPFSDRYTCWQRTHCGPYVR
ncbi:MAG TPA: hypothetical protein VER96_26935 [Polyangiaceae bacterium]|nr:hypothetical protein [Polyangiaceae bacterium]